MGWKSSNDFLFTGNNSGSDDFCALGNENDEFSLAYDLYVDPYRGNRVVEVKEILDKEEKPKELKFKSVEINGKTLEYLVLDEFYTHGEIEEYARKNNSRLPNEDELRELIKFCGVDKFTNNFPGHQYPDKVIIGCLGELIQFWLDSSSTGDTIEAIMILNSEQSKILTTSIPKNCGISACLIKK